MFARGAAGALLGTAFAIVAGCGGKGGALVLTVGSVAEAGAFSESDAEGAGTLDVTIAAAGGTTLCAGRCVTLTATAAGGEAPYSFQWDPAVPGSGGSVTVCPGVTTAYRVTATDSSARAGELTVPAQTGSTRMTIVVAADCLDGAAPVDDAGPNGGPALWLAQPTSAAWTGITVGVRQGATVYWASWTSAGTGTASGTLSPPSGAIAVTYTGDLYGSQITGTSDPWTPTSFFTGPTVPDAPPGPGMLEIAGGTSQHDGFTFSEPVTNPLIAITSLGTGWESQSATLIFSAPITVVSADAGQSPYFAGTSSILAADGGVSGVEASGVVEVEGTF
jgi:hypothetical protein